MTEPIRRILLTNDDSHRSPLLSTAIDALTPFGDLTVVVPAEEQSWRSKAISRYGVVFAGEEQIFGKRALTLTGTPADCVNIAVNHFFERDKPPDLVVSGINAGLNAGLGFILSSGTVAACTEANLAGFPALAISQAFDTDTMNRYAAEYALAPDVATRLRAQALPFITRALRVLMSSSRFLNPSVTWNLNLPFHCIDSTLKCCRVASTRYLSCFGRSDDGSFRHNLKDIERDPSLEADSGLLAAGYATLSKLRWQGVSSDFTEEEKAALSHA